MGSTGPFVAARPRRAGLMALVAGSVFGLTAPDALAGPEGAKVVRGQVSIQQSGGGLTTIRAGNNSIINYRSFNIAGGETVRFVQPSATARVLNRIQGPAPTRIDGSLLANGRVYLVNPAGVTFGKNSVLNVGGLYASSGQTSDADFLRGAAPFPTVTGPVISQGLIAAASVTLVGRTIENAGRIVADGGIVTTIVGTDVMVRERNGQIYAKIDSRNLSAQPAPAGAVGRLTSLAVGDAVALAIRNSGEISAAGGTVTAMAGAGSVSNTGTISTSVDSGQAGSISMSGDTLVNKGTIEANAESGRAGSISFTSTSSTTLADGSLVSAAGGTGIADGGKVLVHAYNGDTMMTAGAAVDISGGALGGDGGTAEISAGGKLGILGTLRGDVATGYKSATVLFDPLDIYILTNGQGGSTNDGEMSGDGIVLGSDGGSDEIWYISPSAIEAFSGDVRLEATRDINIHEEINKTTGGLTLTAGRDINLFQVPDALSGPSLGGPFTFTIAANFLDLKAGHSINDNFIFGTTLRAFTGDIRTEGTTGSVTFGLASVSAGRAVSITQAESKFVGAGPFGFIDNPDQTNLVIRITDGFLVMGGDFGGVSGHQS